MGLREWLTDSYGKRRELVKQWIETASWLDRLIENYRNGYAYLLPRDYFDKFQNYPKPPARPVLGEGEEEWQEGLCRAFKTGELEKIIERLPTVKQLKKEIKEDLAKKFGGFILLGKGTVPYPYGTLAKLPREYNIAIVQPQNLRQRHTYIIGKTGSGKTNLMLYMIYQDLEAGRGLAFLTPDFSVIQNQLLPYIPQDRINDVVLFNPDDLDFPIPLNPLYLEPYEDIDLKVDQNLNILKEAVGEQQLGSRMENILRYCLYALTQRPKSSLADIKRLLNPRDASLVQEVIADPNIDQDTKAYFETEYPFPEMSRTAITNRLDKLLKPKRIFNLLCHPQGCFNFRQAIDNRKILLFNLSDALLGRSNAQLIGQLIVAKLQQAVFSREDTPEKERVPFYLYIDEFQTFTSQSAVSYATILQRARKMNLSLILAHQQTGSIPQSLLEEVLGNVSTIIAFNISAKDASRISKELVFKKGVEYVGEQRVKPLPTIPPDWLERLVVGQAGCRVANESLMLKVPLAKRETESDPKEIKEQVIQASRTNFGVPITVPEPTPQQRFIAQLERSINHQDQDEGEEFLE